MDDERYPPIVCAVLMTGSRPDPRHRGGVARHGRRAMRRRWPSSNGSSRVWRAAGSPRRRPSIGVSLSRREPAERARCHARGRNEQATAGNEQDEQGRGCRCVSSSISTCARATRSAWRLAPGGLRGARRRLSLRARRAPARGAAREGADGGAHLPEERHLHRRRVGQRDPARHSEWAPGRIEPEID